MRSDRILSGLACVAALAAAGCDNYTHIYSGGQTPTSESDADTDTDTDADADADSDADTDTTAPISAFTFQIGPGCADGSVLTLTRFEFEAETSSYLEEAKVQPLKSIGGLCSTTVALDPPSEDEMVPFGDGAETMLWAVYLPAIYADTGATLELTMENAPDYVSSDTGSSGTYPGLTGGLAYVGIGAEFPAYVSGTIPDNLQALGFVQGWNVVKINGSTLDVEANVGDATGAVSVDLEQNLVASDTLVLSGNQTERESSPAYAVGLRPYGWLSRSSVYQAAMSPALAVTGSGATAPWSLTITGVPPADHYIQSEQYGEVEDFDGCCQKEFPVAPEVPVVFTDDGDGAMEFSDFVDGAMCLDNYMVLVVHYPHPTHLWLAEYYRENAITPGP